MIIFQRSPESLSIMANLQHQEAEIATMPDMPERLVKGKKRPFSGAEYLESLRDGREVYIYGERVKDVTSHPAFRNQAVSVSKLYDACTMPNRRRSSHRGP